ncbi:type-F conjugative transfer system pilin assembly protein TrbC (plasmid) [Lelliottia sp. WB101]|uniref:type-F conjugative transfer system pilin assembly protein TrbC n=1 Tax=Lelliottia sp. WB101 TaxID=2153385 RepID=UPI000D20B6E4|nr:type-F conjugative transfer system pilin assembly protein TrbC [Lelliottia sp. WB101]AVZ00460.1 type-F conjugative transfer system pilin assembly protein TrbC [Lelliottia sp. WB101]
MKLLSLLPAIALAGSVSAFADAGGDNKAFFNDMLQMDRERHLVLSAPDFARPPALSGQDADYIASMKRQQQAKPDDSAPVVMMFVSFSMPEEDLRESGERCGRPGRDGIAPGMVNGDMRQTGTRIAQLVKETNTGGMQIDPVSFRRYGITSVPTLVVKCGTTTDRVQGDITLREALKKVAESGDCAGFAESVLNREVAHG